MGYLVEMGAGELMGRKEVAGEDEEDEDEGIAGPSEFRSPSGTQTRCHKPG
jgi:hypothetical protein